MINIGKYPEDGNANVYHAQRLAADQSLKR
jgi:hypothetical protein